MIRSPLGLRLEPAADLREGARLAARLGARGVVVDATGDLAPDRLGETGRREVRHLLRSAEVELIAMHLPTRRPFDTEDGLEDRLRRADRAFALAFDLGSRLVLARVGAVPPEDDAARRPVFLGALAELARRADHRGVRLAIETGTEPGDALRGVLDSLDSPGLAASFDPGALIRGRFDPVAAVVALGPWVAHAYATDATSPGRASSPFDPRALPPGRLDWEAYLGALEEIGYRGYLTLWPDPSADPAAQFSALAGRLRAF